MAKQRPFPVTGKPGGIDSKFLRVDFDSFPAANFDALVETKTPRLGWARNTICPCRGYNAQTDQLDPACPQCNGLGFFFFRPPKYVVNTGELGSFTAEQKAVLDRAKAVAIRGLVTGLEADPDMFRQLGHWVFGTARLTTRGENRVGYFDRIISIDELAVYCELVTCTGGQTLPTRYSVVDHNYVGSLTGGDLSANLEAVDGVLTWKTGKAPASGTLVTASYQYHPVWTVQSHIHVMRSSLAKFKKPPEDLQTPEGDTKFLPVQTLLRLEHLPMDPG